MISKRFKYTKFCEPYKYSAGQKKEIKLVQDKLTTGTFSLEKTCCPCGGEDFGEVATTERYGLPLNTVLCDNCGSLRFREYLTEESLAQFYINHYQTMYGRLSDIPSYFMRQGSYGRRVLESYRSILTPKSHILEIGCGAAGALNIFHREGLEVYGCEYSQILVNYANKKGLENIHQGSIFDIKNKLPKNIKFDLIYIHHVFEHVIDPIKLLKRCKDLLSNTGKLVIGVPDFMKIDQYDNPGCDLMVFLHIAHKYNFTSECFASMAAQGELQGQSVSLHPDYPTPWAVQPELWYEFSKSDSNVLTKKNNTDKKIGSEIYQHLINIESFYSNKGATKNSKINKLLNFIKF